MSDQAGTKLLRRLLTLQAELRQCGVRCEHFGRTPLYIEAGATIPPELLRRVNELRRELTEPEEAGSEEESAPDEVRVVESVDGTDPSEPLLDSLFAISRFRNLPGSGEKD